LRRAGWPDDRPVWTGSCPCQPFSAAGKGLGFDDERHLWPAWYWLIGERRPAIVFGEQVASSAVDPWIDLVQADVEALDYAYGCVPFPSAGVGAPHIRDRAYWMAYAYGRARRERRAHVREGADGSDAQSWAGSGGSGMSGRLADTDSRQRGGLAIVRGLERDGQDAGRSQGRGEP
ncbi:DNA cytosine methyltransferase, partial [Burkholderia pseudomallei]|uniref:DNA cytosine methyltransferase n=1 Tax=Burkholderia pseudomallei TaxID=28450 RepID=UPI0019402B24